MKLNRFAAAAICLAATLSTHAAVIVGTDPAGDNGGFGVGFSFSPTVNLAIAQRFTVGPSAATVGGITVWMNQNNTAPAGQFTLQVMDAIGPTATAADVLLTLTGTFPNTPGEPGSPVSGSPSAAALPHLPVTFSGLGLTLAGDTDYYLVITSAAGPDTGWGTTTIDLADTPGSVGSSFVASASVGVAGPGAFSHTTIAGYDDFDLGNPNPAHTLFRIDAVAVAGVPEPSSTLLLALGLAAAATVRRRQAVPA